MLDRVACTPMRTASMPQVDFTAILALTALLADARGDNSAERARFSQGRDRVGRVRGALVDGLAAAHHPVHAGACLCDGRAPARYRGETPPSDTPRGCRRSLCRRCGGCSGIWYGSGRLRLRLPSTGPSGAGGISSVRENVTGANELDTDTMPGL